MKKFETRSFDLEINDNSAVPIYDQIKNAIKLAIFTNKLDDGDKIISIRDLSTRHNINPLTVMKAYNQLEGEGFMRSRRGAGYYVQIDNEKLKQGREEIFKREVSGFLERIASLGYKVDDFLKEFDKFVKERGKEK